MGSRMSGWIGGFLMMLCCGTLSAADLTLVANGEPNAVIVATAESHAQLAAREIQKYIEKMSGAKLPIVNEGEADNSGLPVKIVIGHSKFAADNGVKIPGGFKEVVGDPNVFEEEGFVIKTKGNAIVIGGNSDGPYQGTIYAGYEFLDRLGCRWYFPGDWGEVVPEKKTVSFPETDVLSRPDFVLRRLGLGGWIPSTQQERGIYGNWIRKAKFSSGNFYPNVGDGLLSYLLPPNEYFEKRPEYYAIRKDGSRSVGEHPTLTY